MHRSGHTLFLDGVYIENKHGGLCFKRCKAPSHETLQQLVHRISHRVARYLEKQGYLQRDEENSYALLDGLDETDAALHHWQGCAITYRIAMGSQTGRKVMTLQTLPATDEPFGSDRLAKGAGFSLHAGVSAEAHEIEKVERLCRYIALHGCRVLRRLGIIASALAQRYLNNGWSSPLLGKSAIN